MGSSIQFENTYAEDERWIEAGAEAFALHFAACSYADRRNTDGRIPKSMVTRISLMSHPDSVWDSVETLVRLGFWKSARDAYQVVNYVEEKIGLSAEEKLENRAKWAADKKWRRKHNAGNHNECPPDKCRQSGKMSHSDSRETPNGSPSGSPSEVLRYTTRPDSTRPDSTRHDLRSRSESKSGPGASAMALRDSAGATSRASAPAREKPDLTPGPPMSGVDIVANTLRGLIYDPAQEAEDEIDWDGFK